VSDKPRVLVIERDPTAEPTEFRRALEERFDVIAVRSLGRALAQLRSQQFAGVYVDSAQLSAMRWAGMSLQADEILDAIADGVAIVNPDLQILWANPEFLEWTSPEVEAVGSEYYRALGSPEVVGDEPSPFTAAVAARVPATTTLRVGANRYLRLTVTPVFDHDGRPTHLIALSRDVTAEIHQEQKLDAIYRAGEELADLTPDELADMTVEDRTNLLKYNIIRHMRDLLGLDYMEIRLLDRETKRLVPLLTEGMTPLAAQRELFASKEGNGVTGFVAATGQSYLCPDTASDPLYLEGAAGARSSLTVPLASHGTVIGTLNVESASANAFDDRDRQFLEIYSRSIGSALHTLELLHAEQRHIASASVEAISRELALPLDDILSDVTTVIDRYDGPDAEIATRLRNLLGRAREIRARIQQVGSTIAPPESRRKDRPAPRFEGLRILVADGEESIRRSAHVLLGPEGALVETVQTGERALALARMTEYDVALADIRLSDMDGYAIYTRLRSVRPGMPVILMTGFGYDPTHSIVKARQEGLQAVLYKPFRAERLFESVEQVARGKLGLGSAPEKPESPALSSTDGTSQASARPQRRLSLGSDMRTDDARESQQG
jgi:CheY-like chemotaxis protein/GAF domain-containing protein/PAS domain-containing protein